MGAGDQVIVHTAARHKFPRSGGFGPLYHAFRNLTRPVARVSPTFIPSLILFSSGEDPRTHLPRGAPGPLCHAFRDPNRPVTRVHPRTPILSFFSCPGRTNFHT